MISLFRGWILFCFASCAITWLHTKARQNAGQGVELFDCCLACTFNYCSKLTTVQIQALNPVLTWWHTQASMCKSSWTKDPPWSDEDLFGCCSTQLLWGGEWEAAHILRALLCLAHVPDASHGTQLCAPHFPRSGLVPQHNRISTTEAPLRFCVSCVKFCTGQLGVPSALLKQSKSVEVVWRAASWSLPAFQQAMFPHSGNT